MNLRQSKSLFESATLRLTAWYMLILIILSVLFSVIVYSLASNEFGRALGPRRPGEAQIFSQSIDINELREQRIDDSNKRLIANLLLFNLVTITAGGICSFLLARRTLRPVEEALESQSRFSSDAAHELRTPLAVMQSEIEVELRSKRSSKQSHKALLESNLDEVHRLQLLTDRLLTLASNQQLSLCPVEIEDVVIEAVNRSISLAQTKDIIIDNQVGRDQVIANSDSLTDVITILIDNAIKYSLKKSTIIITSLVKDRSVFVSVIDEGIGIAPDEHAKIFHRFYRSDESRSKTNVEGHGLGLSIASRLMSLQNGTVTVTSNKDKGSTFTVRLPKS